MSEGEPVRGIVVAHGGLAEGLVDAVRQIADVGDEALVAVSNRGLSPDALREAIRPRLGKGPVVLFTDLPAGSCGFTARRLCRERAELAVVSGVNLPLLLDFVLHRELPLKELVPRLLTKGRAAMCCAPAELESDARSLVSGG